MAYSAGEAQFANSYELSPIVLTNGIAGGVPGGAMSIFSILQAMSFTGLISSSDVGIDGSFARFYPVAGSTLVDNQIGNYPFANMAIAANAIIAQPLQVSLIMRVPASALNGGYAGKNAIMTSLQSTLEQHNTQEGTYTVLTPSFYFNNLILLHLTDVSGGETIQSQVTWKWDFVQPLITLQGAAQAENSMMSALSSGGVTDGSNFGTSLVTGVPESAQSGVLMPSAAATAGGGIAGDTTVNGFPTSFNIIAGNQ